jgi:LAS superfamily LD-carboxypeptidase LdcB
MRREFMSSFLTYSPHIYAQDQCMNELELTGRARTHVIDLMDPPCSLHFETVASFLAMREAAALDGILLTARSSFRDFDAQLRIWNAKWAGERPLYDRHGALLDRAQLTDAQTVEAILCWSAAPGGSRHHWGSDVDVFDAAAIPAGYKVQLVPSEYEAGGVFAPLSAWLDAHMPRYGFFRPYRTDRGGVSPEPWHLSYAPVSMPALESLSLSMLRHVLEASAIAGKAQVLARLPEIYTRFLLAIDGPEGG